MILVGFTAGGLALARVLLPTMQEPWYFAYPLGGGTPILSAWTVALSVLRIRGPRPRARALFRQPGAAACLASVVVMATWVAFTGLKFAFHRGRDPNNLFA